MQGAFIHVSANPNVTIFGHRRVSYTEVQQVVQAETPDCVFFFSWPFEWRKMSRRIQAVTLRVVIRPSYRWNIQKVKPADKQQQYRTLNWTVSCFRRWNPLNVCCVFCLTCLWSDLYRCIHAVFLVNPVCTVHDILHMSCTKRFNVVVLSSNTYVRQNAHTLCSYQYCTFLPTTYSCYYLFYLQ